MERVLRYLADMDDCFAERRVPLPFGTALFCDALRRVWDLNFVRVESRDVEIEAMLAETERVQAEAGLAHRKLKLPFEARVPDGWKPTRLVVMVHRGSVPETTGPVEEVDAGALRETWEHETRSTYHDEETVRQLIAARLVRDAAAGPRYFAARVDDGLVSECSLFSDGRIAEVDAVTTIEAYRGRGLAKAVVARTVEAAYRAGHDLVFLLADADDWPKELYRRLGFEEIGSTWELLLEAQP
ncbi:MAG TPA: GNAT family N-acetyltransferase [Gaiellaceae bacterium]